MINLASHDTSAEKLLETNVRIKQELKEAGITIINHSNLVECSEVPTTITGKYKGITFTRAWYYWMVNGRIPLATAQKLYDDPIGKEDVRVTGHCGCPPPDEWASEFDLETERQVVDDDEYKRGIEMFKKLPNSSNEWTENYIPRSDAKETAKFVTSYHIDSQEGLNLFVRALKKDGVDGK